jgi:hypothetical protein
MRNGTGEAEKHWVNKFSCQIFGCHLYKVERRDFPHVWRGQSGGFHLVGIVVVYGFLTIVWSCG